MADPDFTVSVPSLAAATSRKIYLHRNTLMYRLDKIEKATGLNVRKFSDAVTFRLITILSRLVR